MSLGDEQHGPAPRGESTPAPGGSSRPSNASAGRRVLHGIPASPGRGAGPVVVLPAPVSEPPAGVRLAPGADVERAVARIDEASAQVQAALRAAAELTEGEARDVLAATATMAADPTLLDDARTRVRTELLVPERAVWEAAVRVAAQFEEIGGYLAERASDVADVRDRLVAALTGRPAPGLPVRAEPFVLVADDVPPALAARLDPGQVVALVTQSGGPTAHTAILARAHGIPAVVATRGLLDTLADDDVVLVDGSLGTVRLDPGVDEIAEAVAHGRRTRRFEGEGRTADGHRVRLFANVGDPRDAAAAAAAGAEGIGLFRTEFCFLDRDTPPSLAEQVEAYRSVLRHFPGKRVVVRTLDAGADKPLPFLTDGAEPNPALGVRGLRTAMTHAEVLETQLEAIALAAQAEDADAWVMAPMVATVDEAQDFVEAATRHRLDRAGVMVEVPSAALLSGQILAHATFASVGTNDLTQYAMAADRQLSALAELADPWQPAVLHLVAATCRGGELQGRPVGVCGEAAADPALAVVLVGMGVASLSMTPAALGDVAAMLSRVRLDEAQRLARLALGAASAADARAIVLRELEG